MTAKQSTVCIVMQLASYFVILQSGHQIHFTATNISQPGNASSELWSRALASQSCHLLSASPCQGISFAHRLHNHPQTTLQNLLITTSCATDPLVAPGHPPPLGMSCLVSQAYSEGSLKTEQTPPGELVPIYPHRAEHRVLSSLIPAEHKENHQCKLCGISPATTWPLQAVTVSRKQIFLESSLQLKVDGKKSPDSIHWPIFCRRSAVL